MISIGSLSLTPLALPPLFGNEIVVNQSITFTQTVLASNYTYVTQSLTFTQSTPVVERINGILQYLTQFQQTIYDRYVTNITINQSITLSQIVNRTFTESISQSIILTQSTPTEIRINGIRQSVTFIQNIKLAHILHQSITFTQNIEDVLLHIYNTIEFIDNITFNYTPTFNIRLQYIVFYQHIHLTYVPAPETQSITFSQIVRRGANELITELIIFTQSTPTYYHIFNPNILQSITFNQQIQLQLTFNLTIIDNITFNSFKTIQIPINGELITIELPNISVSVSGNNSKCLVILQTKQSSIVLPCPLFNDSQNLLQSMIIKRAMNGTKRTYIKPNNRNKINYIFRMDRQKSLEFKQFYLNNLNSNHNGTTNGKINLINGNTINQIIMTNFKGEVWVGYITVDPTFIKKTRWGPCIGNEEVNVTFEFEGIRIS